MYTGPLVAYEPPPLKPKKIHPARQRADQRRVTARRDAAALAPGFGTLLSNARGVIGISRNALAHRIGVDPSYLTRIEHGGRNPPTRIIVEALARELRLGSDELSAFYAAAGQAPPIVVRLGAWSPALEAVCQVLGDSTIDQVDIREFERTIIAIARRWRAVDRE